MQILTTQVQETLLGADQSRADGHAFKDFVSVPVEQHPILERTGFALVGIADNKSPERRLVDRAERIFFGTFVAESPLPGRLETRTASPAQAGLIQRFKNGFSPLIENLADGGTGLNRSLHQQRSAVNIVIHLKQVVGPFFEGRPRIHQRGNLVDPSPIQPGQRQSVDQRRRALIAHASTGGEAETHRDIGTRLARLDGQPLTEILGQFPAAQHVIGDGIAEADIKSTYRLRGQETVELGHGLNLGKRDRQRVGDDPHSLSRYAAEPGLNLAQDLQQLRALGTVTLDDVFQGNNVCGGHECLRKVLDALYQHHP